jgi:hypothetical protein
MQDKGQSGRWRQDDLEPRIVLDAGGEFFAIAVSGRAAARIVASLNRTEAEEMEATLPGLDPGGRAKTRESSH